MTGRPGNRAHCFGLGRGTWLAAVAIAVTLATGSPLRAQEDEDFRAEIAELVTEATTFHGRTNAAATPAQRLRLLKSVLASLDRLATMTDPAPGLTPEQNKWAGEAVTQLVSSGLDRNAVAGRAVAAALAILAQEPGKAERIGIAAELDDLIGSMKRGPARAALAAEIGLALADKGISDRPRRMLQIALGDASAARPAERLDAAQKAAQLALRTAPSNAAQLLADAVAMLESPALRAAAMADAARKLKQTALRENFNPGLAQVLAQFFPARPEAARDAELKNLSVQLLSRGEIDAATVAALGIAADRDQAGALKAIALKLSSSGLALRGLGVAGQVAAPAIRLETLLAVSDDLSRLGYAAAAADGAARAVAAYNVNPAAADSEQTYLRIAVLLARGNYISNAQRMAERLPDAARAANIWSEIAVRFAERGEHADADAALAKVTNPSARAAALNRFAAIRLSRGDLGGAAAAIGGLSGELLDGRVARNIVVGAAREGRADVADGIQRHLQGPDAAIARLATALTRNADATLRQGIDSELAKCAPDEREQTRSEMVAILANQGKAGAARDIASGIQSASLKNEAEDSIIVGDATHGRLNESLKAVRDLPDWRRRVRLFRDIAVGLSLKLDAHKVVAAGLGMRNAPLRGTPGPPRFEPAEQLADDRMTISQGEGSFTLGEIPRWPQLATRASDLRAKVPAATGGEGGLASARHSRYLEKFFEESLGVNAGMVLFEAQKSVNPVFIQLTRGVFGIAELRNLLGSEADRFLPVAGDVATLRLPVVVGPEATLVLSGLESPKIHLSETEGAFLVNVGKLFIVDTELIAFNERKNQPSLAHYADKTKFRPFIVSWSDSEFYLAASRVVSLGYNAGKAYGLALTTGPKSIVSIRDDEKPPLGIMAENSIENCLYGFYSYEAEDAVLIGNEYRDNIVYGVDPHDRSQRLLIAFNTAYGSEEKHGIIISREVNDGAIIGNVTFANKGSGFMLDRSSVGNLIYANTGVLNVQDGLTLFESACNLILNNSMVENERSGIKIRNSYDVAVVDNTVARNAKGGIEGYIAKLEGAAGSELRDFELDPYQPLTTFVATGNVVEANRIGISGKGASGIALGTNLLRRQAPRLFGGDIDQWRVRLLSYVEEGSTTVLASTCVPKRPAHACSLLSRNVMPGSIFDRFYSAEGSKSYCVAKPGTIQHASFGPDPDHTADVE